MPAKAATAVLIDDFVKSVGLYLSYASLLALRSPAKDIMAMENKRLEARSRLLRIGPTLAAELEREKIDSTDLLKLLHCADAGGGAPAVVPLWPDVKAQLQRTAIRMRLRVGKSPDEEMAELEKGTPPFNRASGDWVKNTVAAELERLETRTLASYRAKGIRDKGNTLGRDPDGRVWRRPGTATSHPWYLRSTLRAVNDPEKRG